MHGLAKLVADAVEVITDSVTVTAKLWVRELLVSQLIQECVSGGWESVLQQLL